MGTEISPEITLIRHYKELEGRNAILVVLIRLHGDHNEMGLRRSDSQWEEDGRIERGAGVAKERIVDN